MSPSLLHRAAVALLQVTRARRSNAPGRLAGQIVARDARGDDGAPKRSVVRHVVAEKVDRAGWATWRISPQPGTERSDRIVLALHGGAYVQQIQDAHYRAYVDIVRRSGATVEALVYPLAPHGTADAVVPRVADLITELVEAHGADRVAVLGDSAGAGLAMAAAQELVRRGSAVPGRMVLISPWLDATVSDPRSRIVDDPMLDVDGLIAAGRLWAGPLNAADIRVSPLRGSLIGLPSTSVYSGTLDCLVPDSWRLRDLAEQQGLDMRFTIEPGLVHDWAGFTLLPEYRRASPAILRDLLGD